LHKLNGIDDVNERDSVNLICASMYSSGFLGGWSDPGEWIPYWAAQACEDQPPPCSRLQRLCWHLRPVRKPWLDARSISPLPLPKRRGRDSAALPTDLSTSVGLRLSGAARWAHLYRRRRGRAPTTRHGHR